MTRFERRRETRKRIKRSTDVIPVPNHPYRDSAIFYGVLAAILLGVTYWTGGGMWRAVIVAVGILRARDGVLVVPLQEQAGRARPGRIALTVARSVDAAVESLCGDLSRIRAPRGVELNARSWSTEAPLRMLLNNLDPEVAERPEELIVYGGSGKAARNHDALRALVRTLLELGEDETMLVQSGKPVGVLRTHPGRTAGADRKFAARSALGELGRVPPARGARTDHVRPDDRR